MKRYHEHRDIFELANRSYDELSTLIYVSQSRYSDKSVYWILATFEDGTDEIYFELPPEEVGSVEAWDRIEEITYLLVDMLTVELNARLCDMIKR